MNNDSPTKEERSFGAWLRAMPRWKKITVALAVVTVAASGVLHLTAAPATPAGGSLGGLSTSLTEGGTKSIANGGEEPATQGVFRLGFSFLAGFCIGAFIRSTLRVAMIAFGFWLFLTFVLSYFGIVTVNWQAMDTLWDRFSANVAREWGSFQRFMTGSLPAAGLAVTGLAVGLKRH